MYSCSLRSALTCISVPSFSSLLPRPSICISQSIHAQKRILSTPEHLHSSFSSSSGRVTRLSEASSKAKPSESRRPKFPSSRSSGVQSSSKSSHTSFESPLDSNAIDFPLPPLPSRSSSSDASQKRGLAAALLQAETNPVSSFPSRPKISLSPVPSTPSLSLQSPSPSSPPSPSVPSESLPKTSRMKISFKPTGKLNPNKIPLEPQRSEPSPSPSSSIPSSQWGALKISSPSDAADEGIAVTLTPEEKKLKRKQKKLQKKLLMHQQFAEGMDGESGSQGSLSLSSSPSASTQPIINTSPLIYAGFELPPSPWGIPAPSEADKRRGATLFAMNCELTKSALNVADFPTALGTLPEIAFAGRSNVGKSSLINALLQRKKLVKVSSMPGSTQSVNFFEMGNGVMTLVDLPGYGFAKRGRELKSMWQDLMATYLIERQSLRRTCVLIDARHGPMEVDLDFLRMLNESGVSYQIVLTKCDKIHPSELSTVVNQAYELCKGKMNACFPLVICTSSEDGHGLADLRASLAMASGLIDAGKLQ